MKVLAAAFLVACFFPYTQFLPIESYTQPYALALAIPLFVLQGRAVLGSIPCGDALALLGLAFFGTVAFLMDCTPLPDSQELKYLLIYVAPLVQTVAALVVIARYRQMTLTILTVAILVWLAVGLVQTFIDPNFATSMIGEWQDTGEVSMQSGRGVLGLAPEPTHFGFHMIVLAAIVTVLHGSRPIAWACVVGALLLARSASAALTLVLGSCLFVLRMPLKYRLPILAGLLASPFVVFMLLERIDPESSRLLYLASTFLDEPGAILGIDFSVNTRLGGLIATMRDSFDNFLLPHGLSHAAWLDHSRAILSRFTWLFDLSDNGPPSGFGIVIYQLGIFGVLVLYRPITRLLTTPVVSFEQILVLAAVWVFVGQYFISTPGYSLLYACAIYAAMRARETTVEHAPATGDVAATLSRRSG